MRAAIGPKSTEIVELTTPVVMGMVATDVPFSVRVVVSVQESVFGKVYSVYSR